MTTKRTRWLGWVLTLASSIALLVPGSALALPAGAPKIGMVCTPGTVAGLMHTFNLVAKTGTIQTPDGNTVFMWSYANGDAPDSGLFQYPGPVLCATQGETLVVNLSNTLPEPASIVFPGQDAAVTASGGSPGLLTTEAAATTGTVSYSFTAGSPGTYLYESGSNISKQVEMGLYGALIVRPSIDYVAVGVQHRFAYNASTEFDPTREYMLLLSEVDPDLHHAVETGGAYDFTALHNRYYMVNGRAFPDTLQANGTGFLPSQPYGALVRLQPNDSTHTLSSLIRMLNAGTLNHPFHPHGNHTREIAQDGRPILNGANASTEHFGETIGSGQTLDYLIRWDDQVNGDNWNPVTNPLPVVQPSYLNLVFKDGNTWYSGSPYLGYKGTLPTGTLTQNICGEWYFPLHSHALNEFANFDEPFGGMATLLRVDPAGGCFAFPASSKITAGTLNSGTVTNLGIDDPVRTDTATVANGSAVVLDSAVLASDVGAAVSAGTNITVNARILSVNLTLTPHRFTMSANATGGGSSVVIGPRYYRINSAATPTPPTGQHTDWYGQFSGVPAGAANLKATYKGNNGSVSPTGGCCRQNLYIWSWTTSAWVPIAGPTTVGLTDVTVGPVAVPSIPPVGGSWASYIGTGANKGLVRVRVLTDRTANTTTSFVTGGNFMSLVYDAP